MTTTLHPLCEPVPAYMQRLLLMGARFVEGNTSEAVQPDPNPSERDENGAEGNSTPEAKEPEDGKGSKDAVLADLAKERDRRQAAEDALRKYQDAEKTDLERAKDSAKEAETELQTTQRELWLYKALADHPVPSEHRHLVKGDTEEDVRAAAEAISKLTRRPGVVKESGTTGDSKPSGTSVNTGRDLYRERHNHNRKD